MPTTGLVEIVNITGRNLQMLSARGVCALESSSDYVCVCMLAAAKEMSRGKCLNVFQVEDSKVQHTNTTS